MSAKAPDLADSSWEPQKEQIWPMVVCEIARGLGQFDVRCCWDERNLCVNVWGLMLPG